MVITGLTKAKLGNVFQGMKNISLATSNGLVYSWGENLKNENICVENTANTTIGSSNGPKILKSITTKSLLANAASNANVNSNNNSNNNNNNRSRSNSSSSTSGNNNNNSSDSDAIARGTRHTYHTILICLFTVLILCIFTCILCTSMCYLNRAAVGVAR